jgi:protein-disulfide isomerase
MRLVPLALLVGSILAVACSPPGARDDGRSGRADTGDPSAPAIRIGSDLITVGELDAWIKEQLFDQETESGKSAKLYEVRAGAAENMVAQRLLDAEAEKLGTDADSLLESEARKRINVSDADVQRFYDDNKKSFGDRPFDDMKAQIREHLERRAAPEAARAYVQQLRRDAKVEILLERTRTPVAATGPSRGPADAPITLIEFSDYQCPFCRRAEPTVKQVLQQYEGKIRFVFRHFPLDRMHPQARGASEAAACAAEQNKFWEYHEALFAPDAQLDRPGLDAAALKTGLDSAAFKACLDARKTQALVETDVREGEEAGVSGTPAFFINGIPLRGALPLEEFKKVIDEELAAKARG